MPLRPLELVLEEQSKLLFTAMRDTRCNKRVITQFSNTYFLFQGKQYFTIPWYPPVSSILTDRSGYMIDVIFLHFLGLWNIKSYWISCHVFRIFIKPKHHYSRSENCLRQNQIAILIWKGCPKSLQVVCLLFRLWLSINNLGLVWMNYECYFVHDRNSLRQKEVLQVNAKSAYM